MQTQKNFFNCSVKFIEYPFTAGNVEPLLRIKKSLFLLSIYTDELISLPNIIMFLPNPLPSDCDKLPHTSNPLPYPEWQYL